MSDPQFGNAVPYYVCTLKIGHKMVPSFQSILFTLGADVRIQEGIGTFSGALPPSHPPCYFFFQNETNLSGQASKPNI